MVLPVASQSIFALTPVFALQVLPRPWIGQMTNLLVSELYDDASLSSAAQSFNQGWEALQNTQRQEARKPYVESMLVMVSPELVMMVSCFVFVIAPLELFMSSSISWSFRI